MKKIGMTLGPGTKEVSAVERSTQNCKSAPRRGLGSNHSRRQYNAVCDAVLDWA